MTCRYLTYEDRKSIENLYKSGESLVEIASELGVHLATIYREMTRGKTGELDGNGRSGYSAEIAQKTVQESMKRRGHRKPVSVQ
jgi:IS30 family transposase